MALSKLPAFLLPDNNWAYVNASAITHSGLTHASAYDKTYLADLRIERPVIYDQGTGKIRWALNAVRPIDLVYIGHHNTSSAQTVTFKLGSDATFATFAVTQALTVPAWAADGFTTDIVHRFATTQNYRYVEIEFGASGAPAALKIGDIWFGQLTVLPRGFVPFSTPRWRRPAIVHQTGHGVQNVSPRGTKWRELTAQLITTSDAENATAQVLWDAVLGMGLPILLVYDDDAFPVRFTDQWEYPRLGQMTRRLQFVMREESRGLKW